MIPDFFYLHAVFNMHFKFLHGSTICIVTCMISIPLGMFTILAGAMCIPACTICIVAGTISNRIPMGDTCLYFFTHRSELLTSKNKFLPVYFYMDKGQEVSIQRSNCTNGVVRSRGMGYEKC